MLQAWVVDGLNKWYFLEDRELSQSDGFAWIENALEHIKETSNDSSVISEVESDLVEIRNAQSKASKFTKLSRQDFLNLVYEYTIYHNNRNISIDYRDMDGTDEQRANAVLSNSNTWKDQFGENYYQPNAKVKRWEAAYLLANALERNETALYASR